MCIFICLVVSIICLSLAADVTVYNSLDFSFSAPQTAEPHAVSQLPWNFVYHSEDINFFMYITLKNKSSSVTSHYVNYRVDHGTLEVERAFANTVGEYYYVSGYVNFTVIAIQLNLYSSNGLCSSLPVAEGRTDWPVNEDLQYDRLCSHDCVLAVNISNECVDATTTDPTVTIICSTIGVVVGLLVVIAVWIYWSKRNTPQLPNIPQCEPVYLNTLCRSDCDQEIAEIEQHRYEEIQEHQNEEMENQYEEIIL